MPIKKYNPTTSGRRDASVLVTEHSSNDNAPVKRLLRTKSSIAGRNNQGKITVRHRGGGARRLYRMVDFLQEKIDVPGTVARIEYDPNRSAQIALVNYRDGDQRYILAPVGLKVGDSIVSSHGKVDVKPGNRTNLSCIPSGMQVSNIELFPGKGGRVVRSAGSSAVVMSIEGDIVQIKMPSSEIRRFSKDACWSPIFYTGRIKLSVD